MNVEQEIMDKMERSEKCWPRSEMTAAEILTAVGGDPASYEQLMRVIRFMPHFCRSSIRSGLRVYTVRLKLAAVGEGVASSVINT